MKTDIRNLIDLVLQGSGRSYRKIIKDVGMVFGGKRFFHIPPLERIFPEYENYLKRESLPEFLSGLTFYNKAVPAHLTLPQKAVKEIIDYAFKVGNETLLISVIGVHNEYFQPTYFHYEGIWSHVRSLATAGEAFVKELTGKQGFASALNTSPKSDFSVCYSQLAKRIGRKNLNVTNLVELKASLRALAGISFQRKNTQLPWMKNILRAYLIRNYAAHHTKLEPGLFGRAFIEIYNSLFFLIFYAWKVHI